MSSEHTSDRAAGLVQGGVTPRVDRLVEGTGVRLWDPIEEARVDLRTGAAVSPADGDPDRIHFPVDEAVEVTVTELSTTQGASLIVRDGGTIRDHVTVGERASYDAGSHDLEIGSLPLKCYLHTGGAFEVVDEGGVRKIAFEEPSTVTIGVRSHHRSPAATVTTTPDPRDLMRAVSTFGSALKTDSPMRSFPSLRGHPPLLELGSSFEAPTDVEPPSNDVRIEVPERADRIFGVASLAYYLGATVVPGPDPRLIAGDEAYPIDDESFHEAVNRLLERFLTIDAVVRDAELYPEELREQRQFRERYDGDRSGLRHGGLAGRIQAAMAVSRETFDDLVPAWSGTFDVEPSAENAPALPYAAATLAHVRCPDEGDRGPSPAAPPEPVESFFRTTTADGGDVHRRSENVFTLPPVETDTHTYVGEGYPVGASRTTPNALARRHDRTAPEPGPISVAVVCTDERMTGEVDDDLYGLRDALTYDVTVHEQLTVQELRELLGTDVDFLHFVGHVHPDGLECVDGTLDTHTLDHTGVEAFLLNACSSYEQASGLVAAGSRGGVATLSEVPNQVATGAGRSLGRLLNAGFTLQNAVRLMKSEYLSGFRYTVVGDGETFVSQPEATQLSHAELEGTDGAYRVRHRMHHRLAAGLGAGTAPIYDTGGNWCLAGSGSDWQELSASELAEMMTTASSPVMYEGELRWADEFRNADRL